MAPQLQQQGEPIFLRQPEVGDDGCGHEVSSQLSGLFAICGDQHIEARRAQAGFKHGEHRGFPLREDHRGTGAATCGYLMAKALTAQHMSEAAQHPCVVACGIRAESFHGVAPIHNRGAHR